LGKTNKKLWTIRVYLYLIITDAESAFKVTAFEKFIFSEKKKHRKRA